MRRQEDVFFARRDAILQLRHGELRRVTPRSARLHRREP
jgi:hypothetical protein